jgi:hypothetical protein
MDITSTGTYYNQNNHQYELWAVNQLSGEKNLIGTIGGGTPTHMKRYLEDKMWKRFLSSLGARG